MEREKGFEFTRSTISNHAMSRRFPDNRQASSVVSPSPRLPLRTALCTRVHGGFRRIFATGASSDGVLFRPAHYPTWLHLRLVDRLRKPSFTGQ